MSALLDVSDLSVRYGRIAALNGVSLRLHEGEIAAVIGPNGAGKSSLVNAIMGLLPSQGRILFPQAPGAERSVESRVRAGIALVPETRELFGTMTVEDNLHLGAYAIRSVARAEKLRRLEEIYALFPRMKERRTQIAHTLSGGERQMLALGRALMARPRLLMLDEPSLGLAPLIVAEIFRTIERLKQAGVSVLLIEQNARAALRISDIAYVLESGAVQMQGRAADMAADSRIVASYLGAAA